MRGRSHISSLMFIAPLIFILLFSSTLVPALPAVTELTPSFSNIKEAAAQEGQEEGEEEKNSNSDTNQQQDLEAEEEAGEATTEQESSIPEEQTGEQAAAVGQEGSDNDNHNHFPTAYAGPDQTVNEGTIGVTLVGKGEDEDADDELTYLWKRVPQEGEEQEQPPEVILKEADTPQATFDAPSNIEQDITLTFELTVVDGKGEESKDTVNVLVKDIVSTAPAETEQASTEEGHEHGPEEVVDGAAHGEEEQQNLESQSQQLASESGMVYGSFSGQYHQEETGVSGNYVRLHVTAAGSLISSDGVGYSPTGIWQVSFDWIYIRHDGVVEGSHTYSGPASTDIDNKGSHYVSAETGLRLTSPSSFLGGICAVDFEPNSLQGCFPLYYEEHGLSGSESLPDRTSSWSFTPGLQDPPDPPDPEPNPNNPPNPVIAVSPSNTVESDTSVTLDGSQSNDPDPGDSIARYTWQQTGGPDLGLGVLHTQSIGFTPSFTEDTTVTFSLSVSDTRGASATTTAQIMVKAAPNQCSSSSTADPLASSSLLQDSEQSSLRCVPPPPPQCTKSSTTLTELEDEKYPFTATTLDEARSKFQFTVEGTTEKYASETNSNPPEAIAAKFDRAGKITCIEMKVDYFSVYPDWINVATLSQCIQNTWQKFMTQTRIHEEDDKKGDHEDIILKGYKDVHKNLIGKTREEANEYLKKLGENIQKEHDKYDAKTKHGKNIGAVLLGNECPA